MTSINRMEGFRPRMQQFEPGGMRRSERRIQPVQGSMNEFETYRKQLEALGFPPPVAIRLTVLKMFPTEEEQQKIEENNRLGFARWLKDHGKINEAGGAESTHLTGSSIQEVAASASLLFQRVEEQAEEKNHEIEYAAFLEVCQRHEQFEGKVRAYQEHLRSLGMPEDPNV